MFWLFVLADHACAILEAIHVESSLYVNLSKAKKKKSLSQLPLTKKAMCWAFFFFFFFFYKNKLCSIWFFFNWTRAVVVL